MDEDASMSLGIVLSGEELTLPCRFILLMASLAILRRDDDDIEDGFIVCTMNVIIGINVTNPTINHNDVEDLWEILSILRTSSSWVLPATRGLLSSKSTSLPLLYDNIA